jgi:hypothetical protein
MRSAPRTSNPPLIMMPRLNLRATASAWAALRRARRWQKQHLPPTPCRTGDTKRRRPRRALQSLPRCTRRALPAGTSTHATIGTCVRATSSNHDDRSTPLQHSHSLVVAAQQQRRRRARHPAWTAPCFVPLAHRGPRHPPARALARARAQEPRVVVLLRTHSQHC